MCYYICLCEIFFNVAVPTYEIIRLRESGLVVNVFSVEKFIISGLGGCFRAY